jgi:hypothetical protein
MTDLLRTPANAIGAKGITAARFNGINCILKPPNFIRGNIGETTIVLKPYLV